MFVVLQASPDGPFDELLDVGWRSDGTDECSEGLRVDRTRRLLSLASRRAANNVPGIRRSRMLRHAWKETTMKGRFADSSCRSAYPLSHFASDSLICRLAASSARDPSAVRIAPRLGRMPMAWSSPCEIRTCTGG